MKKTVTISISEETYKRLFDLRTNLKFDNGKRVKAKDIDFDYVIDYLIDKINNNENVDEVVR